MAQPILRRHPAPASGLPVLNSAFLLAPEMFELIYGSECRDAIGAQCELLFPEALDPGHIATAWPDGLDKAEVVFTGWNGPCFDKDLLLRLPRLRAVFHGGGTLRPHVTDEFWERGIVITTAADANSIPVAEYTLAAVLLSLKRAWVLDRQVRHERAFPNMLTAIPGAKDATVGLVSLGRIGRLVCQRLQGHDLRVVAYDPTLTRAQFGELGAEPVSLDELMAGSDVVSLHTPLLPETKGMITGDLLRLLKPHAAFINTARGALVREAEMIEVLRARPDVQAILDVTYPEPPPPSSELYDLPNVFLTPHIAGSLGLECRRLGWTMVEEFGRFVRGEPLRHAISREQANNHA